MYQINVVDVPNPVAFDMMLFPEQAQGTSNYILDQFSNINSNLTDVGRRFIEQSREVYDRINDSSLVKASRAALRGVTNGFHHDLIYELGSLEEIQQAQPKMQRYIMAQPDLRSKYLEQLCDGYGEAYVNVQGEDVGHDQYDYRRVMNGMINLSDDESWVVNTYAHDDLDGGRDLTFDEQTDIIGTWDLVKMFVEAGIDPTDPEGGTLGG